MSKLAIEGGTAEVRSPIRRFNTIGQAEVDAAVACLWGYPLSGYLGGEKHGGWHVEELELRWSETFGVKHAVCVNSGTSGLLVAAEAIGLGHGDKFLVSPWTMSATVAAPMFTQADPVFVDIEEETFSLAGSFQKQNGLKATFITNLFGHPAKLANARKVSDALKMYLIEDNAQSMFAMENGKYAGTVGHIGVFSWNYHKHLHCGEGGICVTDDDGLAERMRMARNHGEMASGPIGLNLRLTEIQAAIMLAQLDRANGIIASRRALGERITEGVRGLPIIPPAVRDGCTHVYCGWACKIEHDRDRIVDALRAEGVPIRAGYMRPLYELPAFAPYKRPCPVTERVESQIALIEVCSINPTPAQTDQIVAAFHKVYEHMKVTA